MCKPVLMSAVQRAQDGTTLSRIEIYCDEKGARTVKSERLVSAKRTEEHHAATLAFMRERLASGGT